VCSDEQGGEKDGCPVKARFVGEQKRWAKLRKIKPEKIRHHRPEKKGKKRDAKSERAGGRPSSAGGDRKRTGMNLGPNEKEKNVNSAKGLEEGLSEKKTIRKRE